MMKQSSQTIMHVEEIKHIASNFESIHQNNPSALSPLSLFKVGNILYETNKTNLSTSFTTTTTTTTPAAVNTKEASSSSSIRAKRKDLDEFDTITIAFHNLLTNLDEKYLSRVVFPELYSAFGTVLENSFYNDTLKARITNKFDDSKDVQGFQLVLSSLGPIWGICHGMMIKDNNNNNNNNKKDGVELLQHAFDKSFCFQLAKLYDTLLVECNFISPIHEHTTNHTHDNDGNMNSSEISAVVKDLLECILNILSSLLLHGFIYSKQTTMDIREDDKIQQIMEVLQGMTEQASTTSYCLGDLQLWQKTKERGENISASSRYNTSFAEVIQSMFTNDVQAQKEYLSLVLKSAPTSPSSFQQKSELENQSSSNVKNNQGLSKQKESQQNQRKQSALDRLIQQVHQILPHLGKGYIEAALACYNHNLEETTNALMEGEINSSSLHPRLRALDKSLPERRKESRDTYDSFGSMMNKKDMNKEEEEAREIQRERIRQMVAAEEDEAYKLGVAMASNDAEYNDDYDDQYDGLGDGIGGADSGLYDADFESIKTYNRVAKDIEADRLFWEENRNTNRRGGGMKGGNKKQPITKENDDDYDDVENDGEGEGISKEKAFRGPDKGKGGRIIGPDGKYLPHPKHRKKGGKGNNQNKDDDTKQKKDGQDGKSQSELSKIQKRRKNDNKAKIGNHHRKERALKKGGGA